MVKRKPAPPMDHRDYGTAYRQRDGRVVPTGIGASDGVELAEVPDIDRPGQRGATVRVARRADPLIAILDPRKDGPGREQYLAAETFRRDSAIADGAANTNDPLGTWVSGGANGTGPTGAQIDAQTRMRAAWLAVRGPTNDADVANVVRLVVLGYATLERARTHAKRRHEVVRAWLIEGLESLAAHYGT